MASARRWFLYATPVLMLLACGADTSDRPPITSDPGTTGGTAGGGSSTPTGDGGTTTADAGDAGACNTVVNHGTLVEKIGVIGDPPASLGGTIVPGNYILTDYSAFQGSQGVTSGPTGISVSSTILLSSTLIQENQHIVSSAAPQDVLTADNMTATGSTLVVIEACPNQGLAKQLAYTADTDKFILTDPISKEVRTYTLSN